ncbi:MAG: winged helix-turn-helix transcriptional regulator [Thermoplasmata archaeon]
MPLELEKRKKIYELIRKNPGLHFRELLRLLDMNVGDLQYNLSVLEKESLIVGKDEFGYRRYYPNQMEFPEEKKVLPFLRQPVQRKIIIEILMKEKATLNEVSQDLGIKNQTVLYHIKKMLKSGMIIQEKEGKNIYYIMKNSDLISRTLIRYRGGFSDKFVEKFIEFWKSSGKI